MNGRLLRQLAQDRARDSAAAGVERVRYREAAEQAVREREERYPVLTAENAQEAIDWQEARIKELLA